MNETVIAKRKEIITNGLREELGILVDCVKRGAGSTNDGNTARRFFANPSVAARVTGFDENLLRRFATILDTMACGFEVDTEKFLATAFKRPRIMN